MLDAVVIGAGPYGLSVAAHLRHRGIPFRIFGYPMDSWTDHMPRGMLLKSDGFASNIHDPDIAFTLKRFCAENAIEYADFGTPVRLETFAAYGLAFRRRMVSDLEEQLVTRVGRGSSGFEIETESGEVLGAKRVILAVGITHFAHMPFELTGLPTEFVSHSFEHADLQRFAGRSVVVIGAGASAIDLAALLNRTGADVQLVARAKALEFHGRLAADKPRSLWQQIRSPHSGLGPGLKSRFYADFPNLFWHFPESARLEIVRNFLGPAGGWFSKDAVLGKVPLLLGCKIKGGEVLGERVRLQFVSLNSGPREILSQHVIAATGYRVDLERLAFLAPEVRREIKSVKSSPILSSTFESTCPGLYFVGLAAANSFGPVMRFAYGAGFAARRVCAAVARSSIRGRSWSRAPQVEAPTREVPRAR